MNTEIKRKLNKYGFKLAGELLGEAVTTTGKPKLEWDMINDGAPAVYLIVWGDGDSKTGKAESFVSRARQYR